MKIIFIDTNFWLIFYLQKIDLFSELERLVPEKFKIVVSKGIIKELKDIKETSRGKKGTAVKIALELIKKRGVEIIGSHDEVDGFIVKLAQQDNENLVVCTNDRELRKKLKELRVKVVVMREKNRLDFL